MVSVPEQVSNSSGEIRSPRLKALLMKKEIANAKKPLDLPAPKEPQSNDHRRTKGKKKEKDGVKEKENKAKGKEKEIKRATSMKTKSHKLLDKESNNPEKGKVTKENENDLKQLILSVVSELKKEEQKEEIKRRKVHREDESSSEKSSERMKKNEDTQGKNKRKRKRYEADSSESDEKMNPPKQIRRENDPPFWLPGTPYFPTPFSTSPPSYSPFISLHPAANSSPPAFANSIQNSDKQEPTRYSCLICPQCRTRQSFNPPVRIDVVCCMNCGSLYQ